MEEIPITRQVADFLGPYLAPAFDWAPPDVRTFLLGDGIWLTLAVLVLVIVGALMLLLRLVERVLGGIKRLFTTPHKDTTEEELREDLTSCPWPPGPPSEVVLAYYHIPVRVRLVVLALQGREENLEGTDLHRLLERMIPGLGRVVQQDQPRIRLWPRQISPLGFCALFHRCTPKPEGEQNDSHWILLAGRVTLAKQPYLLGLGLYADQPVAVERMTLEPRQWLDQLRLYAPQR